MVVGIYNPYHESLGGGEQYMFAFALYFLRNKHQVIYFTDNPNEVRQAEERFGFDLTGIKVQKNIFTSKSFISKAVTTHKLDILLFYSDGSVPLSFSKQTFLIFQFPVLWVKGKSIQYKLKLKKINGILVNSNFTKKFIDNIFGQQSKVILPYINNFEVNNLNKENLILSVGRFTSAMNTKRQDILITAFKKLYDQGTKDWKLILTGGTRVDDTLFVKQLKEDAGGYPIEVKPDIPRKLLQELYGKASIYWHAAGYKIDENLHPENVEHFGISTIEAMSCGAVPIVYPVGGQKEVVSHKLNGLWWYTVDDLVELTRNLIVDTAFKNKLAKEAIVSSSKYSIQKFNQAVKSVFHI